MTYRRMANVEYTFSVTEIDVHDNRVQTLIIAKPIAEFNT